MPIYDEDRDYPGDVALEIPEPYVQGGARHYRVKPRTGSPG